MAVTIAYRYAMMKSGVSIAAVNEAAQLVGGITKLAHILGVKRPALYQWREVPAKRVLQIEAATKGKITRHQLRPDLYPIEGAA